MKSNIELTKIQQLWASRPPELRTKADTLFNEKQIFDIVGKIFCPGPFYIYVFNFINQSFDYVSDSIEDVLGIAPSEITVPKLYEMAHPNDTARVLQSESVAAKFLFEEINSPKIMDYKVSYMFRLRRADGGYANIMHQAMGLKIDDNLRFITVLGVHTDITHLTPTPEPTISFLDINHKESIYNIDPHNPEFNMSKISNQSPLSERELEVLGHLAEGRTINEVAGNLNLAPGTVRSHRDNIRRKLDSNNTTQAVAIAIRNGWI